MQKQSDWWYKSKPIIRYWLDEVDACWTWCLLLSRKIVEELKEFKTDREDFEFCERAIEHWYKIHYDASLTCKHYVTYPI
jgi:GT2 family glycosyltransferase